MSSLRVAGVLTINCGAGREDRESGAIRYWEPPQARYDCTLCGGREGPVTGSIRVAEFVARARALHRAHCSPPGAA